MGDSRFSSSMQAFCNLSAKGLRLHDFNGDFMMTFFISGSVRAMNEKSLTSDVSIDFSLFV